MNTQKKKIKRGLAGFLAFCLMMTSVNTAAFGAEDMPPVDSGRIVEMKLDGQQLKDAALEAIQKGTQDDSQGVTLESLGLDQEDGDSTLKKYQKLFSANEDGALYEVTPEFVTSSSIPTDAGLRVFIRGNAAEDYVINEKEDFIFLFTNGSVETMTFQVNIDGNTIQNVRVRGTVVAEEPVAPEPTESVAPTEEATTEAPEVTETTEAPEVTETTEAPKSTETATEETTEVVVSEETETEVSEETEAKTEETEAEGVESNVSISARQVSLVSSSYDEEDEDDGGEIFLIDDVNGTTVDQGTTTETTVTRKSVKIKGDLYSNEIQLEGIVARAFVTTLKDVLIYEEMVSKATASNATGSNATLVVKHAYPEEGGTYRITEEVITSFVVGNVVHANDVKEDGEYADFFQIIKSEPESLVLEGNNEITLYYELDRNRIGTLDFGLLETNNRRLRSARTIPEGEVAAYKTSYWTNQAKMEAEILLSVEGEPKKTPVDVILVLDGSGSMNGLNKEGILGEDKDGNLITRLSVARDSALSFAETILDRNKGITDYNLKNRVAVVPFDDDVYGATQYLMTEMGEATRPGTTTDGDGGVADALYRYFKYSGYGGTNYTAAFEKANTVFKESFENGVKPAGRNTFVVFMTDGCPNRDKLVNGEFTYKTGEEYVNKLKTEYDATVYTVGIGLENIQVSGDESPKFARDLLLKLSSGSKYSYDVSDGDIQEGLVEIFEGIVDKVLLAGTKAEITDKIHPDFVIDTSRPLPNGVTYNKSNHTVTWVVGDIYKSAQQVKIPVKLDPDKTFSTDKKFYTNDGVKLTYKDVSGKDVVKEDFANPALSLSGGTVNIRYSLANADGIFIDSAGNPLPAGTPDTYRILVKEVSEVIKTLNETTTIGLDDTMTVDGTTYTTYGESKTVVIPSLATGETHTVYVPVYIGAVAEYTYVVNYYNNSVATKPIHTTNALAEVGYDIIGNVDIDEYHPGDGYLLQPSIQLNGGTGLVTSDPSKNIVDIVYLKKGTISFAPSNKSDVYTGSPLTTTGKEIEDAVQGLQNGDTIEITLKGEPSISITEVGAITLNPEDIVITIKRGDKDVTDEYVMNKPEVSLKITKASLELDLVGTNVTYNGEPHTLTKTGVVGTVVGVVTYTYAEGSTNSTTPTGSYTTTLPTLTDAGSKRIFVKAEAGGNYEAVTGYADVVIGKRPVTLQAGSTSKTYDGTPLTYGVVTADRTTDPNVGIVQGHRVTATVEGSQTDAGSSENVIREYKIVDTSDGTKDYTKNYETTLKAGKLEIFQVSVNGVLIVEAPDDKHQYDGTTKTYEPKVTLTNLPADTLIKVEYQVGVQGTWTTEQPTYKDVAHSNGFVWVRASNPNINGYAGGIGSITVTPAPVTVVIDNHGKVFGERDPAFTGTINGLFEKNGIGTVTYKRAPGFEKEENAGSEIPIVIDSYTTNKNYTVTTEKEGTLTITPKGGNSVTAKSVKNTYTGNPLAYPAINATLEGSTVWYSKTGNEGDWSKEPPTFTNVNWDAVAGKEIPYPVYVKATKDNHEDVLSEGSMTILQANVLIGADSKEMFFGDTIPTLTGGFLQGKEYPNDFTYEYVVGEPITKPGSYFIRVKVTNKTNNCEVGTKSGFLEVKGATLKATIASSGGVYNGTPYAPGTVTVTDKNNNAVTDATITYGIGASGDNQPANGYHSEIPTRVNAGSYQIFVKVEKEHHTTAYASALLNITKRPVILAAASAEKKYDGQPLTNSSVIGKIPENLDALSAGLLSGHTGVATVSGSQTEVGSSDNTINLATLDVWDQNNTSMIGNYTVTGENGTLTITKVSATDVIDLSGINIKETYSGNAHTYRATAVLKGGVTNTPITIEYSFTGEDGSWSTENPVVTTVGDSKPVIYVRAGNVNLDGFVVLQGSAVIDAKPVTIIVASMTKKFKEADPDFSGSILGEVVGDELSDVIYRRAILGDGSEEPVGTEIPLTADYTTNDNYVVTLKEGTLTIVASDANSIDGTHETAEYTGNLISYPTLEAGVEGSTVWYSQTGADGSWSETPPTFTNAGTYPVFVKATMEGYEDTAVSEGSMIVSPKPATIVVADKEISFGSQLPTLEGTIDGRVIESDFTVTYNVKGEVTATGIYPITATVTENPNYIVTVTPGTLTVTSGNLSLEVEGNNGVYNGDAYTLNNLEVKDATGTVVTEDGETTITYATGTPGNDQPTTGYGDRKPSFTDAGSYEVFVKVVRPNHEEQVVSKTITIDPRKVLITADSATKPYDGTPLIKESATPSALMDSEGNVDLETGLLSNHHILVDTSGTITNWQATPVENAVIDGSVTIKTDQGQNIKISNYKITYGTGTLTITKASIKGTITVDGPSIEFDFNNAAHQYPGDRVNAVSSLGDTLAVEYSIDGGLTWSQTAPEAFVNVEENGHKVLIRAGNSNYEGYVEVDSTVTIKPAAVTITVSDKEKTYGKNDPEFQGMIAGVVPGDELGIGTVTYGRDPRHADLEGVMDTIHILASYTPNKNYIVTTVPGVLTIKASTENTLNIVNNTATYDGTRHTLESVTAGAEGSTILYALRADAPESEWLDTMPSFTDVKIVDGVVQPYEIFIKVTNANFVETTGKGSVLIEKRPLVIKAADATQVFNNVALTKPEATITSNEKLAEIDSFEILKVEGSQTAVGSSSNEIKEVSIVRTGEGQRAARSVTDFYNITLLPGILSVTENPHNLTIAYAYQKGEEGDAAALPQNYEKAFHFGEQFLVVTPIIEGYVATMKQVEGAMSLDHISVVVVYEKDENGNNIPDNQEEKFIITFLPGTRGRLEGTTTFENLVTGLAFGKAVTVPTTVPNRNYSFIGWKDQTTGITGLMDTTAPITESKIYEAQWEYQGGNGGGGGGGNGGGPNTGTPTVPGGPGQTGPVTEILPEDVPLAALPPNVDNAEPWIIDDGEVPLAALPKTGDTSAALQLSLLLSSLMAGIYIAFGKKKKEEN